MMFGFNRGLLKQPARETDLFYRKSSPQLPSSLYRNQPNMANLISGLDTNTSKSDSFTYRSLKKEIVPLFGTPPEEVKYSTFRAFLNGKDDLEYENKRYTSNHQVIKAMFDDEKMKYEDMVRELTTQVKKKSLLPAVTMRMLKRMVEEEGWSRNCQVPLDQKKEIVKKFNNGESLKTLVNDYPNLKLDKSKLSRWNSQIESKESHNSQNPRKPRQNTFNRHDPQQAQQQSTFNRDDVPSRSPGVNPYQTSSSPAQGNVHSPYRPSLQSGLATDNQGKICLEPDPFGNQGLSSFFAKDLFLSRQPHR